jgi:hypothetical protein
MDKDTQHGFCGMDLDSEHAWMHGCRNAEKKLSPASLVSASLQRLVHRHSAIMVSPVPLVTDYSVSAQLWRQVYNVE